AANGRITAHADQDPEKEITMTLETARVMTPLGDFTLFFHGSAVCAHSFTDRREAMLAALQRRFGDSKVVERHDAGPVGAALAAYVAGDPAPFDGLEPDPG